MAVVGFVAEDTGTKIRLSLLDNDVPINLVAKDVFIQYLMGTAAEAVEVAAVIVDEDDGIVEHTWAAGELKPGRLRISATVLNGPEKISSLDILEIEVRRLLG